MSKVPTLTREQEVLAFQQIEKGGPVGERAREQFILLNQTLVGWVAARYLDKGLTREELLSANNVGLLKAVAKFDYRRGLKFSTMSVRWIEGAITEAFKASKKQKDSEALIRCTDEGVPLVVNESAFALPTEDVENIGEEDLKGTFHPELPKDEPRIEDYLDLREVAKDVGTELSPKKVRLEDMGGSHSGCAEFGNLRGEDPEQEARGIENIAARTTLTPIDVDEIGLRIQRAARRLASYQQARVIVLRLGLGGNKQHTLAEIAAVLGVTLQRVHVIQKAAITSLREIDPTLEMFFEQTI